MFVAIVRFDKLIFHLKRIRSDCFRFAVFALGIDSFLCTSFSLTFSSIVLRGRFYFAFWPHTRKYLFSFLWTCEIEFSLLPSPSPLVAFKCTRIVASLRTWPISPLTEANLLKFMCHIGREKSLTQKKKM